MSHLEARIRRIETDLENQRSMVHSIVSPSKLNDETANELSSKILKTEIEVQDSRSILAQLRLRGEQRISRGKRAAAAAAAAATTATQASSQPKEEKLKTNRQLNPKLGNNKLTKKPSAKQLHRSPSDSSQKTVTNENKHNIYQPSSFYFQGMMLDNSTDINAYDHAPPGHGMDWTLFDQHQQDHRQPNSNEFMTSADGMQNLFTNAPADHLMFPDKLIDTSPVSTRSSSLASNLGFPVNLQPSNSTTSTTSNATSATSCSSLTSCDNLFGFAMEDMMIHSSEPQGNNFCFCL